MKTIIGAVTLAAATLSAGAADAARMVAPVSVSVASGGTAGSFWTVDNVIDQSGLLQYYEPGVTDFEDYVAGDPRHNDSINTRWLSDENITSAKLVFDFGADVTLSAFAFWDDFSTSNSTFRFTSLDGLTTFAEVAVADPNQRGVGAQAFRLPSITTRYLTLEILGCNPTPSGTLRGGCGLQEIAFAEAPAGVPEPATWAMMILGFGAAGTVLRRRKLCAAA
ncbi:MULTISPECIES: PEPxxWA-CTERM sorting domain-containing protein [unclassified Phenylobacterium]|uniref:PEPxxWA-CTERM sorting domain-containing protein n=1 Tax=unclassified Phenylobacterium TaxID=2640670 RepID=UPI00083A8E10|nr:MULTISPECIES: PEPxxWA-CTERM sorting domain-containing protein [unclassified Phenylobacterium]